MTRIDLEPLSRVRTPKASEPPSSMPRLATSPAASELEFEEEDTIVQVRPRLGE